MAKNKKEVGPGRSRQAEGVMELIREGTALQIELLGAAARVWSDIVERVASYNRELTNELMRFTGGETDANLSLNHLVNVGKGHVHALEDLPGKIGTGFKERVQKRAGPVRKRAGRPTDT
jgi:hypothetical protein